MKAATLARPLRGQDICGDMACAWTCGSRDAYVLVDGLGHGPFAAAAATLAIEQLQASLPGSSTDDLHHILAECDKALTLSRGAAVGLALFEPGTGSFAFCGVGNVRGALAGSRLRWLSSDPGIIGGGFKRLETLRVVLDEVALLCLWSDGLSSRVAFDDLPPDARVDPQLAADWLLETYASGTDDAGILCALLEPAA